MSLPVPPKYVVIPAERIEQAYAPDKPRRALLATFIRILSLAWEAKYAQTPRMNEEELISFLKLSRRQYFEQKADMELLGWLRSSHPVPGFVQFSFSRVADALENVDAENRTASAENRTALKRMEEEESLKLKDSESSSSSLEEPVRKTALTESEAKMHQLVDNLHLVFEPDRFGVLEWRPKFAAGIPERVLGWIAKAYHDRDNLTRGGGPIGLIVAHILERDEPHPYYLGSATKILPREYLQLLGLVTTVTDEETDEPEELPAVDQEYASAVHERVRLAMEKADAKQRAKAALKEDA